MLNGQAKSYTFYFKSAMPHLGEFDKGNIILYGNFAITVQLDVPFPSVSVDYYVKDAPMRFRQSLSYTKTERRENKTHNWRFYYFGENDGFVYVEYNKRTKKYSVSISINTLENRKSEAARVLSGYFSWDENEGAYYSEIDFKNAYKVTSEP